jgi:response regulator RpfG family c-di-GMP phosphodiesterase
MPKTKDRVAGMAGNARPYVERAIRDEELREHVRQAYAAARDIYDELVGPRGVAELATRVAKDEEVQDNLRTAIAELRQAANRLQGRRQSRGGRSFLLLLGVLVGLFYNPITGPSLRGWVKKRLFGGDEFGFDSGSSGNSGSSSGT